MTTWKALRESYRALRQAAVDGSELADCWAQFCEQAIAVTREAPEHLRLILDLIERQRAGRDRAAVAILDHGCGSGMTLLVLAALGYRDIRGVDVGGDIAPLNRIGREALCHPDNRFLVFDGGALPLPDASVDVVLSQQVLEHVRPAFFESYYREEARILKPGGFAYHQVPHRLVPFESHSRTWFLHYLPRPLFMAALRVFRNDVATLETHLFLRWPWRHKRMVRRFIGPCCDLTLRRLKQVRNLQTYDGVRGLRRLLDRMIDMPVIGGAMGAVLIWFVQLDTVAVKQRGGHGD